MRKKILLASLFCISSLVLIHPYVYTNATGAPNGNTGAPGESTCAQSGCHSGNTINPSGGSLGIKILDNGTEVTDFINGKTYDVEVTLVRDGINAAGFQTTVKGSNAGGGTLATGGNTDVKKSAAYITHTSPATHHAGMGMWSFKWTAPAAGAGNVTFYTSGNAANGNGTTSGDFIYTTSKTLTPAATAIDEKTLFAQNMRVYPNPVQNVANVAFTVPENEKLNVVLQIYTVAGKLVKTETMQAKPFISNTIYADLSGFKKGMYLAKLNVGNYSEVKKMMKD